MEPESLFHVAFKIFFGAINVGVGVKDLDVIFVEKVLYFGCVGAIINLAQVQTYLQVPEFGGVEVTFDRAVKCIRAAPILRKDVILACKNLLFLSFFITSPCLSPLNVTNIPMPDPRI